MCMHADQINCMISPPSFQELLPPLLYDILNEDTSIYAAVFDYLWEGISQKANETNS